MTTTFEQRQKLRFIEISDPGARVKRWHDSLNGPLVISPNGDWKVVLPSGKVHVIARGTEIDEPHHILN